MKNSLRFRLRAVCAIALALAVSPTLAAEDIDIFAQGLGVTPKPNVLIVLDNSSNWSATLGSNACFPASDNTKFHSEVCALRTVASGLDDSLRLGLMMFAESGTNGGYVRYAIRDMNVANKTAFASLMDNLVQNGSGTDSSGANQPYGTTMFEVFKYFGGYTSPAHATDDVAGTPQTDTAFGRTAFAGGASNSTGTARRDYLGNNSGAVNQATGNRSATKNGADTFTALPDATSDIYTPGIIDGCAKNFVIVISNGNPSVGGEAGSPNSATLLGNVGGNTAQITSGGSTVHASMLDEWARFLFTTDVSSKKGQQKVVTYTIAVYQPQNSGAISNTDQQMIKLMKSAAAAGGGKFFAATNAAEVLNAIRKILNEVQAVNSVFVSASLPVSVNTQGTFLNQIYMGMFRPDATANPRWMGNLKQYQFVLDADTGSLFLADTNGDRAVNPSTGFLSPGADSFWSHDSTFWANSPSGLPASASDKPDGEVVEKGGAAQGLRDAFAASQATRRVFTCAATGCTAGAALNFTFDQTNIAGATYQTAFGAASAAELTSLVRWARGEDNANGDPAVTGWTSAEQGPGLPTTVRASIHGDVLHSRPVVLNYPSIGPYVFYGANDGTLRGVKGGQEATDGDESWAFVAPDFFAKFKRLRDASPQLRTPSTPTGITPAPLPKDYFFDGPIGSFQDATRAWIFVAARRGGPVIYAFDVTDPTTPKFMWKKTSADLPNLGQTWSEPKAITVKALADPVLIFGAGYDPGEDNTPATASLLPVGGPGRGVYILNARTGVQEAFLKTAANGFTITNPVPADIAVADVDGDTFIDRAYFGDTGGNMWRIDLDASTPAGWSLFKFANLSSGLTARKIFFQPDIVISKDFHTVLIGTGDREKPLVQTSSDRFFGLRDTFVGKDATGMVPIAFSDIAAAATDATTTACSVKGWFVSMASGEKVINAPLTVAGVTFFSTNQPAPPPVGDDDDGVCTTGLGKARSYALDFTCGASGIDRNGDGVKNTDDLYIELVGGGLPPSPVGGIVRLNDGRLVGFIIGGGDSSSPIEAGRVRVDIPKTRQKVYWNSKTDK